MRPKKKKSDPVLQEDLKVENSAEQQQSKKKLSPREIASELQADIIPANKTLEDCIIEQLDLCNTIIDPAIRKQNTDDVNAFIRDQVKIAHKTQSFSKLTLERIHNLADAIISTSGLAKVKNRTALKLYTEYYILWLVLHSV